MDLASNIIGLLKETISLGKETIKLNPQKTDKIERELQNAIALQGWHEFGVRGKYDKISAEIYAMIKNARKARQQGYKEQSNNILEEARYESSKLVDYLKGLRTEWHKTHREITKKNTGKSCTNKSTYKPYDGCNCDDDDDSDYFR